MNFIKNIFTGIKWFVTMCLSESGTVSFGRTLSAFWSLYFAFQDYHFFLVNQHHLVDNSTILTQLTVISTSYAITKAKDALVQTISPSTESK